MFLPAEPHIDMFLARRLPGSSPAVRRLRADLLEFGASPTTRSLLLRGPIGAGKSTLARIGGLLRRVAPLAADEAKLILDTIKVTPEGQIDQRSIAPWYTELSLTGLVENIAASQLFGTVKGAFTDAVDSPGLFEKASRGLAGDRSAGAALTGGVVFLDEIGDLAPSLQGKLLPVYSGGSFCRVGAEGRKDAGLTFEGVVITASWRNLEGLVRPDLLSRVSGRVIDVPGIDDRKEDFSHIVDGLQTELIYQFGASVRRMLVVEPKLAREYWQEREAAVKPLDGQVVRRLSDVEWSRHGNFRGLRIAIERLVIAGRSPDEVLAELPHTQNNSVDFQEKTLLTRLFEREADGTTLGAHVHEIEISDRRFLRASLGSDPAALARLASNLGIDVPQLKIQLRQLDRQRRFGSRDIP